MLKMAHVLKKLWHQHRISAVKALKHCIMPYSALSVSIPAMQHLEEQHPLCWRFFPPLSLWRWLLCQALCCIFVESKEIDFFFFFSIPSVMDVIYSGTRELEGKFLGIHSMHEIWSLCSTDPNKPSHWPETGCRSGASKANLVYNAVFVSAYLKE